MDAVADRLQRTNPRLRRDRAEFLAPHWAHLLPDGRAELSSDPLHKLPTPIVHHMEDVYATWSRVTAPALWVGASDSFIGRWLDEGDAGIAQRMAHVPDAQWARIEDASHMLHHDQPEALARVLEAFLAPSR
jgi:pimeloyl-ACP methyl ester carboxylesterase